MLLFHRRKSLEYRARDSVKIKFQGALEEDFHFKGFKISHFNWILEKIKKNILDFKHVKVEENSKQESNGILGKRLRKKNPQNLYKI